MVEKTTENVIDKAVSKAKGKATSKPKADAGPAKNETGAARPRKFDYGIAPASVLAVVKDKMPETAEDGTYHIGKGLDKPYNIIAEACKGRGKGVDVNEFNAAGGTRSHIRKLARSGRITITGEDGTVYPIDYVKPAPKPKKEKAA